MTFRKLVYKVHEYLGLATLVPLIVIALTGSLLSFEQEIDHRINADLLLVESTGPQLPAERLVEAARRSIGERAGEPLFIWYPTAQGTATIVAFEYPDATDEHLHHVRVSVDPVTGRVLGAREAGGFFGVVRELHAALLLGEGGAVTVGILGVTMALSLLTGLIYWWPRWSKFARSLSLRVDLGLLRAMFDIHRAGGAYTFVVLLVVAVSGTVFPFYKAWEDAAAIVSPVRPKAPSVTSRPTGAPPVSIDTVIATARAQFPNARFVYADYPHGPTATFRAVLNQPGELSKEFGTTKVWIDQYSGLPLFEIDALSFSAGETVNFALVLLHSGSYFGLPGRILVFLSGFALTALCISGLYLWSRRQLLLARGRRKRRARDPVGPASAAR